MQNMLILFVFVRRAVDSGFRVAFRLNNPRNRGGGQPSSSAARLSMRLTSMARAHTHPPRPPNTRDVTYGVWWWGGKAASPPAVTLYTTANGTVPGVVRRTCASEELLV